jgi:hypothetical protein
MLPLMREATRHGFSHSTCAPNVLEMSPLHRCSLSDMLQGIDPLAVHGLFLVFEALDILNVATALLGNVLHSLLQEDLALGELRLHIYFFLAQHISLAPPVGLFPLELIQLFLNQCLHHWSDFLLNLKINLSSIFH